MMREYLKAAADANSSLTGGPCPEPDRIAALYSGLLSDIEAEAMRDHLAGCRSCLEIAKDARQFFAAVSGPLDTKTARAGSADAATAAVDASSRVERRSWWQVLVGSLGAHPAFTFAVAAALLIAVVSAVLVWEVFRLRNQLEQARVAQDNWERQAQELDQQLAQERTRADQLRAELQQEGVPPVPRKATTPFEPGKSDRTILPEPERAQLNIATFVLAPSLIRGFGQQSFELSRAATHVALKIGPLTEEYKSYTAELRTADGQHKWRGGMKDQSAGPGKVISLLIPASVFDKHDYVLKIMGVTSAGNFEEVGQYPFRLVRQ